MTEVATTVLTGPGGEVRIGDEYPFRIIGERINPTGRKQLTEELKVMDMTTVKADAVAQVAAGAAVLDLNAGIPGFDEPAMLSAVVRAVHEVVDVPLCIDSSTPEALEAAVPLAQGKVLINSVTAEDHSLERLLPLVKKFGAAVIGMANDSDGISMDPEVRLAAARKIVEAAADHGIPREDVIIDPLTMPIGAAPDAATSMFDTMRLIREELGVNLSLRRLEHLVRDARPPGDRRHVPVDVDHGRHEHRDHEPAARAGPQGDPGRRPAAGPRRVRGRVDRRAPPGARGRARGGLMAGSKVEVTYLPSEKKVRVPEGTTLFNAAHWAGLPIESTCGGRGTCGKCGVKVLEGEAELSLADYRHLPDKLDDGWRLSCQCPINGPMTVEVPRLMKMPKAATMGVGRFVLLEPNVVKRHFELPAPSLEDHRSHLARVLDAIEEEGYTRNHDWEVLPRVARAMRTTTNVTATLVGEYLVDVEPGDTTDRMFGASFDIGTTTCVCTLVDLRNGAAVAVASTINHQTPFGADVIARMARAMQDDEDIAKLQAAAIVDRERAARPRERRGRRRDRGDLRGGRRRATPRCCTCCCGVNPESIALAPYVATFTRAAGPARRPDRVRHPPAGVGGALPVDRRLRRRRHRGRHRRDRARARPRDAPARRRGHERRDRVRLGRALRRDRRARRARRSRAARSSAGCAPPTARSRAWSLTDGEVELQVIGGDEVEPRGICGSGLIDIVAQLRLVGLLDDGGKMTSREDAEAAGHPLAGQLIVRDEVKAFVLTGDVVLTQTDVRALQFAKGAISTGIETAMRALNLTAADLDEVMLAGSFGSYINPQSARVIGLVPPVPVEKIKAVGNTASEGAKMALMSFREREVAFEIPGIVEYIELSGEEDFNDRFIGNLGFPTPEELDRCGGRTRRPRRGERRGVTT